ncbi:MAG: hypothetical protein AB8B93_03970 [Pseudomonadales bacterium]
MALLWVATVQSGMAVAKPSTLQQGLQAGAAETLLPVPRDTYLAGYGRDRKATGSHDPLMARVVLLSDADTTLAVVSADNIGLTRPDVQRIQQRSSVLLAAAGTQINPDHIIVSSTHTHAGPDVLGLWGKHALASGRDPALMTVWVEAIARLLVTAAEAREPVLLSAASAATPQAWVENRSEPGSLDDTLSTLTLVSAGSGATMASLTNYACHPTVLGPDNTLSSADWVSGFYQAMSASQPGVHLFLQGAIGGWVQPLQNTRTIEEARGYGRSLAAATLKLQQTAVVEADPQLDIATTTTHFELDNFGLRLLMWLGVMDRPTSSAGIPADLAWLRIGRTQLLTHPGETAPAYSIASRELLQSQDPVFILGLTQDALGYILRPEFFADDAPYPDAEYLTSVSLGVKTGPELMRSIGQLLRSQPATAAAPTPTDTAMETAR